MSSPVVAVTHWPKVADVNAFFPSITDDEITRYQTYWRTLTPEDYLETFERWLFAFCSVHTSWAANVRGFERECFFGRCSRVERWILKMFPSKVR